MEEVISSIIMYIMGFIEIVMYDEWMASRFQRVRVDVSSKKKWSLYLIGTIGTSVIKFLPLPFPIILVINMIFLVGLGHTVFKEELIQEIGFTLFYIVLVYGLDFLVMGVFGENIAISNKVIIIQESSLYIILRMLSKLLLVAMIEVFSKIDFHKKNNGTPYVTRWMGYGFLLAVVSMYCLIRVIRQLQDTLPRASYIYMTIVALGILINNMVFHYVAQRLRDWMNKEKEYEVIQYENTILMAAALDKEKMNKEIRKMWHDFNNHMSCVDMLLQMNHVERARAYIKNMNASCETTYMGIKTGNEIADAVMNQKYRRAQNHHIELTVSGQLQENLPINQIDLCALLSNSLDNAIEACCQIEDKQLRTITVSFKIFETYLWIHVSNSIKEEAVNNKELITTKKDKSKHGIGMSSMQTIVEKYQGSLEWKYDKNQFILAITFKNTLYKIV